MNKNNYDIIYLMNKGKTLNEIVNILNINEKKLLESLKTIILNGYDFDKEYYVNGDIKYQINKGIQNDKFNLMTIDNKDLKMLFISDLHLCHIDDDLKAIDKVYEYAIKNDIHTIFNLGDLIQNTYTGCKVKHGTLVEQLSYVVDKYPYDKSIVNYILYGNHDFYSLKEYGINIGRIIEQNRLDMVSLGYGEKEVFIKNDSIGLKHDLGQNNQNNIVNPLLYFFGHSHRAKYVIGNSYMRKPYNIYVPSLSKVQMKGYEYLPIEGFLEVQFEFDNSLFKKMEITQFDTEEKVKVVNKLKLDLERRNKN